MRAVRLHNLRDLRVDDIPSPSEPGPDQVLIGVQAAGICGSDLHNFRTGQWITRKPSVAGHEFCGRILAIGEKVAGLHVGQPVVADSLFWCGQCPQCITGNKNACVTLGFVGEVCDGGFAEQVLLPARLVLPRPESMNPRAAAMSEPLAVSLHAIRRMRLESGAAVLIVGCGAIGGLCALILARRHSGTILLCDNNANKAKAVAEVSNGKVVDLTVQSISAANDGRPIRAVLDATGSVAVLRQLLDVIGTNSTVGLVGISHGKLDLNPNTLVEREISVVGCHAFRDELPEAISMAHEFETDLIGLIDETITLAEVPEAYGRLLSGQSHRLKTIIEVSP